MFLGVNLLNGELFERFSKLAVARFGKTFVSEFSKERCAAANSGLRFLLNRGCFMERLFLEVWCFRCSWSLGHLLLPRIWIRCYLVGPHHLGGLLLWCLFRNSATCWRYQLCLIEVAASRTNLDVRVNLINLGDFLRPLFLLNQDLIALLTFTGANLDRTIVVSLPNVGSVLFFLLEWRDHDLWLLFVGLLVDDCSSFCVLGRAKLLILQTTFGLSACIEWSEFFGFRWLLFPLEIHLVRHQEWLLRTSKLIGVVQRDLAQLYKANRCTGDLFPLEISWRWYDDFLVEFTQFWRRIRTSF